MSVEQSRAAFDQGMYPDEQPVIDRLIGEAALSAKDRKAIVAKGAAYVRHIREAAEPGLMEVFLAEYGLSTDEGVALMCLAEALLRVPDAETMDDLIEDKIAPSDWGKHLGQSASSLVNASTWALMLTGRVLGTEAEGITGQLRSAVKRLGEPVIRTAVARAMREMGRQFVLGEDIDAAMKRARGMQDKGFTYSYDMLGEAARTERDAKGYHLAYSEAISAIARHCTADSVAENPGISVKLSALHPRYEEAKRVRVMAELVPRLRALAILAKSAGMGLNIDAEEADRLDLSLAVIDACLAQPGLEGWDGFGVVVQAYGPRAGYVIDMLHDMAVRLDRRIMVRLVKGAYWDAEIKRAQVEGMPGFPVFTSKAATDISYIANARKLLGMTDRIYPQFATHNAHTVAAVLHLADALGVGPDQFEFQRLHGMGEALHLHVLQTEKTHCRIYAPVGAHEDLLAYLVRRLLENGANSSFVNQIVDEDVPAEEVAADPFEAGPSVRITQPAELFAPDRANSRGRDVMHRPTLDALDAARAPFLTARWGKTGAEVRNPADAEDIVGWVKHATAETCAAAIHAASPWGADVTTRAAILNKVADAYEDNAAELFALLAREAGKALPDCVGELREAVDFLRFYAHEAQGLTSKGPRGIWTCISPWNFPLAIFTGQIAAALATGNAVLAKPAPQTPLIAAKAVELMHAAGVPVKALQLLPGGPEVGALLTSSPQIAGVAFTGSTGTALKIRSAMAEHCTPGTPLIAETGGLNAMIVDSTALPEHAVRDVVMSAFRSTGQRCSALRCLYVQEDIAAPFLRMLYGAMDELSLGNPWDMSTDLGPIIDATARDGIRAYIEDAGDRVLHQIAVPETGHFIGPTVIKVSGIAEMTREIFGPVLHVATFAASELDQVIADINATGYGLTFGLHTRIDDRVQTIVDRVEAGNIYVNRNQIGAVVGSQPFGGEGLSGTGPKAGGAGYLHRFVLDPAPNTVVGPQDLPGPTGESNRLTRHARGPILCAGPTPEDAAQQAAAVEALGGVAEIAVAPDLSRPDVAGVIWWGDDAEGRLMDKQLSQRSGPIVPLITGMPDAGHVCHERHVCIDTTAAGGNAALLAEVAAV